MSYEMMVGLAVTDRAAYAEYRRHMQPILAEIAEGGFRYDFEVATTLVSVAGHEINRVFLLYASSREAWDRVAQDPRYLAIRARFFEPAVAGVTILMEASR